jgi:hypothetical protein
MRQDNLKVEARFKRTFGSGEIVELPIRSVRRESPTSAKAVMMIGPVGSVGIPTSFVPPSSHFNQKGNVPAGLLNTG